MSESRPTPPAELMEAILDAMPDGVIAMDRQWRITSFNRAAERMTGVRRDDALGRRCCDVLKSSICQSDCAFRETLGTGQTNVSRAVYLERPDQPRLPVSISTSLLRDGEGRVIGGVETIRDLTLVEALRKKLTGRYTFHDIVSKNHRMQQIFSILPQIAASDSTVLVEGESGTGKELLARAIHELSPRARRPLVAVNCAALPDSLLESELFGYKAGAFTDARRDKPGRFALAEGGTLLLDEIGDVSPALQARLLRVLQEKTYEPLGSTRSEAADVRIVAATHRDLEEEVRAGRFREDLFYRINVVRLTIPPLRERPEDIPLLVEHFIGEFNRLRGCAVERAGEETLAILVAHDWPGNVRELENVIEHAFVLCSGGEIRPEHLPRRLVEHVAAHRRGVASMPPVDGALRCAERDALIATLERCDWNRLAAARTLGIHKSTLFRKIRALGIELPERDGRHRERVGPASNGLR